MAIAGIETLLLSGAAGALLLACWHDVATRTLPDGIAALLALGGAAAQFLAGDLGGSLLVAALVLLGAAVAWRSGALGGGDVKLLAACALLAGAARVPLLLVGTALAGGLLTLPYLLGRRWPPAIPGRAASLPARVWRAELRRIGRGGPLPYALAIGAGTALTLLDRS
ncbi:prepilin peptidase [Muricoccus radiodurans]|uniref:prepilin peptidase n=1 Tax=Muricoccus radiodurans TaxID=2231721 RepID=UPI003CFA3604